MLIQGGRISSGVWCTVSVVGAYWISSISRLRCTTLPGVSARLRPGAKAVASTMLSRPSFRSCSRLRAPSARLAPPVSMARRSAAGLDSSSSDGLIASTNWRRWKFEALPLGLVHVLRLALLAAASPRRAGTAPSACGRPGCRAIPARRSACRRRRGLPSGAEPAPAHHRRPASFQTSVAALRKRAFNSAAEAMACPGLRSERSQTVRSARAISAQSTGTTSRSGLAFHIWSMERRIGSFARRSLSCFTPEASSWSAAASGVICHHRLLKLSQLSLHSRAELDAAFNQDDQTPSITSGPWPEKPGAEAASPDVKSGFLLSNDAISFALVRSA